MKHKVGDIVRSGTGDLYTISNPDPNDYRGTHIIWGVNKHGQEVALSKHSATILSQEEAALAILKGEI